MKEPGFHESQGEKGLVAQGLMLPLNSEGWVRTGARIHTMTFLPVGLTYFKLLSINCLTFPCLLFLTTIGYQDRSNHSFFKPTLKKCFIVYTIKPIFLLMAIWLETI